MNSIVLSAQKRITGKAGKKEMTQTDVAGVVYGSSIETFSVKAASNDVQKVLRSAGSNQIVTLDVDGTKHSVLFKDVQLDPISNRVQHFDMYEVKKGEKVTVNVPIQLMGDSEAEKLGRGVTVYLTEVEVMSVPSKIPTGFEIDKSALNEAGDTLTIADIKVQDKDIEIQAEPTDVVAKVEEIVENEVEDTTVSAEDAAGAEASEEASEETEG